MKKHIIIVVSTRDYPFNESRSNYVRIDDTPLNDVVRKLHLNNNDIDAIRSKYPDNFEQMILAQQRNCFWVNYEKGIWFDRSTHKMKDWYWTTMVFNSPIYRAVLDSQDISFHVYVAPCTNEKRDLIQRRAYIEGVIQSAIAEFRSTEQGEINNIIALVHGPDILDSNSGFVSTENLSKDKNSSTDESVKDSCIPSGTVYSDFHEVLSIIRYQHEPLDPYYSLIVGPIVNNTLIAGNCEALLNHLPKQDKKSSLIASYKKILNL